MNGTILCRMEEYNMTLHEYIEDMRGTHSSPFPFIDIMAGKDENGNQILEPYMSAGY